MTRFSILLAALLLAAPLALGQSVPTLDEIERLEGLRDGLVRDSAEAIDAFNDFRDGAAQPAVRDSLRQNVSLTNDRLADLRDSLARAYAARQAAAADDGPATRPDTRPAAQTDGDGEATSVEGGGLADGPSSLGPDSLTADAEDNDGSQLNPFVLAMFAVLFALVAGLGWWTLNQRRRVAVVPVTSRAALEAQQRLADQRAFAAQTVSRADFDHLKAQVQKLDADHRALSDWVRTDYQSRLPAAPALAPVASAPAAPALAPVDAAAQAFVEWCRQGTPMMSRVEFFSADVGQRVPGASARAVYRDLNSQAEPVRFDDRGGASPAEFWLVTAGGEMLLVPQPLNAGQFRDLTRVFEGSAAPKGLASLTPARVRDEGGTFALTAPGRVA